MNKAQLLVLWIGAACFVLCAWNPRIVPHSRYRQVQRKFTDQDWERELSRHDLSLTDSKESLRARKNKLLRDMEHDKDRPTEQTDWWDRLFLGVLEERVKYIDMLLSGSLEEREKTVREHIGFRYTRPFDTDTTSLVTRLLIVTVIFSLMTYTLSDKIRAIIKR